jgi:hypothetical protein
MDLAIAVYPLYFHGFTNDLHQISSSKIRSCYFSSSMAKVSKVIARASANASVNEAHRASKPARTKRNVDLILEKS